MSRPMPKEKAVKIMKDFIETGFEKGETLRKNGYSEKTIQSDAGKIINKASDKVKEALSLDKNESPASVAKTVLDITGYQVEDVLKHYRFVVEQERDLPSKLKALAPLLRSVGINLDAEQTNTVIPVLNIGVTERIHGSTEPDSGDTSYNTHCATQKNGYIEGVVVGGEGRTEENPV